MKLCLLCVANSYGPAYTMPATPRGAAGGSGASNVYLPGSMSPSKSRSLRGGVVVRNGTPAAVKGMSLPGIFRSSSTLPRMSARQLQQPIPHNTPSFLRPNSSINFPSAPVAPISSSPLATQAQSFQSPLPVSSSSSLLPQKSCDINEMYMADLCKRVTDHVLPDGESEQLHK